MKKLFIFVMSFLFVAALNPLCIYASEYIQIIDDGNLISAENKEYLADIIDTIIYEHDYYITIVSEDEFNTFEEFDEYIIEFNQLDYSKNGFVFFIGETEEQFSWNYFPYGEHSDIISNSIHDQIKEYSNNVSSYYDFYVAVVNEVDYFLNNVQSNDLEHLSGVGEGELINGYDPIVDAADLFTDSEEAALLDKIKELNVMYNFDITFLTMNEIPNGRYGLMSYFDWYEGIDPTRDGVMFGVNMDPNNREYATSARNSGESVFNFAALSSIDYYVQPLLADEDYYSAFMEFLDITESFLGMEASGDVYVEPIGIEIIGMENIIVWIVGIPLLFALFVASIIVKFVFIRPMKTAVIKVKAKNYIKEGSLNLSINNDVYITKTLTKKYVPKKTSSSSSSGGGSRRSGFGGSRSGRSGKF